GCTDDRELITCVDAQPRGVQRGDVRCARIRLGRPANLDNWFPGTLLDLRRVRGGHREITTSSPGSNVGASRGAPSTSEPEVRICTRASAIRPIWTGTLKICPRARTSTA